jgi:hypothetical protein
MEDPDHAPCDTPASHRNLRNLIGLHNCLSIIASTYPLCLRSAAGRAYQPGNQRNRHSREAHREYPTHPSVPNEILGKEGRANRATFDLQAASTDSKVTECFHRVHRTFFIQLFIGHLLADTDPVSTKREHSFSIQGTVIVY